MLGQLPDHVDELDEYRAAFLVLPVLRAVAAATVTTTAAAAPARKLGGQFWAPPPPRHLVALARAVPELVPEAATGRRSHGSGRADSYHLSHSFSISTKKPREVR